MDKTAERRHMTKGQPAMSAAVLDLVLGMPRDTVISSGAPPDSAHGTQREPTAPAPAAACRLLEHQPDGWETLEIASGWNRNGLIGMEIGQHLSRLIGQFLARAGWQAAARPADEQLGAQKGGPGNGNTTRDADAGATGPNRGPRTTTDEDGRSSSGCRPSPLSGKSGVMALVLSHAYSIGAAIMAERGQGAKGR